MVTDKQVRILMKLIKTGILIVAHQTSNLRLVGVLTGIYKRSEVIKATRIEKVIELLKSI
jgi:hypothetical protein